MRRASGSVAATCGSSPPNPFHDIQRRGVPRFQHRHQRSALPIGTDDIGLGREAVANMCNVANKDGSAVDHLDWRVIQFVNFVRAAVDLDVVLELPHLGRARWQDQVLIADGVSYVRRRQSFRLQSLGIQVYLDLALLTAIRVGNRRAFYGDQLWAKEVLSEVIEFLLGESLSGEGQLKDRNAGRVVCE